MFIRKSSSSKLSLSNSSTATAEWLYNNKGFPPGITVDELFHYRKKKPPDILQVHDNLKLEEGSFQRIKSEYKRRFHSYPSLENVIEKTKRPEGSLKPEGILDFTPEYNEVFIEYPVSKSISSRPKELLNSVYMDIENGDESSDDEQHSKGRRHFARNSLFRRPTNLKLEGDFYTNTENAEKFVTYLLTGRTDVSRKPTTLKLEGEMETKTENRDKYVPYEYQIRPPLFKKDTNLHLEGTLDISTETRDKFIQFETRSRAPLTKHDTNLHLEGDLKLQPEYREAFVEYKEVERPQPKFPINNLKTEGNFDTLSEKSEKFVEHQIHPIIPFLRGYDTNKKFTLGNDVVVKRAEYKEKFVEHPKIERHFQQRPRGNLKPEGDMEIITESKRQFIQKPVAKTEMRKANNNLLLEGNFEMNPEYRNAYVNFYRDAYGKFGIKKNENEPEKRKRSTNHLSNTGKMEGTPEYKSSFVDFPRQRPCVKKPEGHLRNEGNLSNTTEKRAQFIEHPKGTKTRPLKRQTELKLEGPFECQPEYRRAYIDYITRERAERLPRPIENIGIQPIRVFDGRSSPSIATKEDEANAVPPSIISESSAAISEPKQNSPSLTNDKVRKKSTRRHVSLSPIPKPSSRAPSKENISKIETSLFGPKVPNPSTKSKYYSSQAKTERRSNEENIRARVARARRRYGSPVMVENLAYTPRPSLQSQPVLKSTDRWKREDEHGENNSFVVLARLEARYSSDKSNQLNEFERNKVGYKELYKEQKWMPSWYASSSSK